MAAWQMMKLIRNVDSSKRCEMRDTAYALRDSFPVWFPRCQHSRLASVAITNGLLNNLFMSMVLLYYYYYFFGERLAFHYKVRSRLLCAVFCE